MNAWMSEALGDMRSDALKMAARAQILEEIVGESPPVDGHVYRAALALELVTLELLDSVDTAQEERTQIRQVAADAYRLFRQVDRENNPLQHGLRVLRQSCLAVIGEMGADAARHLRADFPEGLPTDSADWRERALASIIDLWLRLIRKSGWEDRDCVLEGINQLRQLQGQYEGEYLQSCEAASSRSAALELVAIYHLAKAAEILALYSTEGVVDGNYKIQNLLDAQFDRARAACEHMGSALLEPLARLLSAAAQQLADNSIWTVTRAVNSRVTKFVRSLVERGRGASVIFDVLPPQRQALAERGLLGSSRRAVVVSLPTSSGKTLIAQFRILQALNQFDEQRGWVAYLAPTRTLVRQVASRLRRDFGPLGIAVEQVSPALAVDGVEAELLRKDGSAEFRVLVTTPEKLDLMLRQGWEKEIGRPLTLVVVDEAHNLKEGARGLKLELLLSTINAECQYAQFLLLTPFIPNGKEVARWLGDANSDDISLSLDWLPNDRIVGIVRPKKGERRARSSFGCSLSLETVHTSRATLVTDESLVLRTEKECPKTFSQMSTIAEVAAAATAKLSERGSVIAMHSSPRFVWSLAERIRSQKAVSQATSSEVQLVQDFLRLELGDHFPLVELLSHGIGVHHAGLSDDVRGLMEWLFEQGKLDVLAATTTIAQGVNFPVSGVVMASNSYYQKGIGPVDMPSSDFWNIAGRAGRVDQASLGVVVLAAADDASAEKLKLFINRKSEELTSSLLEIVATAGDLIDDLGLIVYQRPEWSSFLQFITHSYRQMGKPPQFADKVEQLLRGTFGFGKLRSADPALASRLLRSVRLYTDYLARPHQPLALVDSTGFSLQSIKSAMIAAKEEGLSGDSWSADRLFAKDSSELQKMMGVLLRIPELRDNLGEVTGGEGPNGAKLARILKSWVAGDSIERIAADFFSAPGRSEIDQVTVCGQNLFGKLAQTAAWGLGALLSITGDKLPPEERERLSNLSARVFYGVSSDQAISLRLLGVPRLAANQLAKNMPGEARGSVSGARGWLRNLSASEWTYRVGSGGSVYRKVWRVLEGVD